MGMRVTNWAAPAHRYVVMSNRYIIYENILCKTGPLTFGFLVNVANAMKS